MEHHGHEKKPMLKGPKQLQRIVKDHMKVEPDKLALKLKTDLVNGLKSEIVEITEKNKTTKQSQIERNRITFGVNKLPTMHSPSFAFIFLEQFKDGIVIIMILAAVIQLLVGALLKTSRSNVCVIQGVAIILNISVVCLVQAWNLYTKEKQFCRFESESVDKNFWVIRDGREQMIPQSELVVGDIMKIMQGDQCPADGILLSSLAMKMDEQQVEGKVQLQKIDQKNPWIVSGSFVVEGHGRYLITSVGANSIYGDKIVQLRESKKKNKTDLQKKLEYLVKIISCFGMVSALFVVDVLIIRFFTDGLQHNPQNYTLFIDYIMLGITVLVVGVPEGLPMAVTLAIAYHLKTMKKEFVQVRRYQKLEKCGSLSILCTDKTNIITKNEMTMMKFYAVSGATEDVKNIIANRMMNQRTFFEQSLALNLCLPSHTVLEKGTSNRIIGSQISGCFLKFARDALQIDYSEIRRSTASHSSTEKSDDKTIVNSRDFSPLQKRESIMVDVKMYQPPPMLLEAHQRIESRGQYYAICRGDARTILKRCVLYIDEKTSEIDVLTKQVRLDIEKKILEYSKAALKVIAVGFKHIEQLDDDPIQQMENDLVFQCICAFKDELREGVQESIQQLREGGVRTILVTSDSPEAALTFSRQAGIVPDEDDAAKYTCDAKTFAGMGIDEQKRVLDTIRCMSLCGPEDKQRLIRLFKERGEVVGATGDDISDEIQMKEADVAFSLGTAGTQIAIAVSDIVLLNDSFNTIVNAVKWGRIVLQNTRKFLQYQLQINIVQFVISFVGSAAVGQSPLTSQQLLVVNLIMDSFGSLALATELPEQSIKVDLKGLKHHGEKKFMSPAMIRNITCGCIYQLTMQMLMMWSDAFCFTPSQISKQKKLDYRTTSAFNYFMFNNVFNMFASRRIRKVNIFDKVFTQYWLWAIFAIDLALQLLIMLIPFLNLEVFSMYTCDGDPIECGGLVQLSISWQTWVLDIGLAVAGIFVSVIVRLIKVPDESEEKKEVIDWENDEVIKFQKNVILPLYVAKESAEKKPHSGGGGHHSE